MDLAECDRREHAGVILDRVSDADFWIFFLRRHRCRGGRRRPTPQNQPRMCTHDASRRIRENSSCGRAVAATLDLLAENVNAFDEDHWLCNRDNVIYLKLQEPASILDNAVAAAAPAVSSPVQACENKRRWIGSPGRGASSFDGCRHKRRKLVVFCPVLGLKLLPAAVGS